MVNFFRFSTVNGVKGPQIAVEPRRRGGNTEGSRAALASPEVSEWTSRPLQRLRLLAQDELLDLAGGGLGQRAEDHFLRRLEAGEALAAATGRAACWERWCTG